MKRILYVVAISMAILLFLSSCSQNTNSQNDTNGDVNITTKTKEEGQPLAPETEEAFPIVGAYDYTIVKECYDLMTSGEKLIRSTVELQKSMWELSLHSDTDDIKNSFTNTLDKSGVASTIIQTNTMLQLKFSEYQKSNFDPNIHEVLEKSVNAYCLLHDLTIDANGKYADFTITYESYTEAFIIAYNDLVAYLYEINVFAD